MTTIRLLALLSALVLALSACGGDDEAEPPLAEPPPPAETEDEREGADCRVVDAAEPREDGGETEPEERLDEDTTHRVVVATNCGEFTITLEPERSPRAAASFAALVERGFFDGTAIHRVVPDFVIQGGDPTATGTGGPGYTTVDPPAEDTTYERGVVAMAKRGDEPPGAAGSQFFVVTAEDAGLPPEYAVIGRISDGIDAVDRIGGLGDAATQQPSQAVVVEEMRLERG
jgi:peptidyl-prolyl cis-trans isomerase B (cyclophilin B)